jgi:hypothetical protein
MRSCIVSGNFVLCVAGHLSGECSPRSHCRRGLVALAQTYKVTRDHNFPRRKLIFGYNDNNKTALRPLGGSVAEIRLYSNSQSNGMKRTPDTSHSWKNQRRRNLRTECNANLQHITKIAIFWDVVTFGLIGCYRHFGGTRCLHRVTWILKLMDI